MRPMRTAFLAAVAVLAGVAARVAAAAPKAEGVRRTVKVLNEGLVPGEPACLLMTWENPTDEDAAITDYFVRAVRVRREGTAGEAPLWWLNPTSRRFVPPIPVRAHGRHARRLWLAVGRDKKSFKAPPALLWPEPGTYRIWFDGEDEADGFALKVAEPADDEMKAAVKAWDTAVATCFVGELGSIGGAQPSIDALLTEHPGTRLAAYAVFVKARAQEESADADREKLLDAARVYEMIIDQHGRLPVCEEAFVRAIDLYSGAERETDARALAEDLAKAFPDGDQVAEVRARYGENFERLGRRAPGGHRSKSGKPARLVLKGLDRVPEPARATLRDFVQAYASGDGAKIGAHLARDFMSDLGPGGDYLLYTWRTPARCTATLTITVKKSEAAKAYTRPAGEGGSSERTWQGDLCVVEAVRSIEIDGPDKPPPDVPQLTWVLSQYPDGSWKVVSDHHDSPTLMTARLAKGIWRILPEGFAGWRISDGKNDRCPYEEVKQVLAPDQSIDEEQTRWINKTLHMMGDGTRARVVGEAVLYVKDPDNPRKRARPVNHLVAIFIRLGEGKQMLLDSVHVTDKPWDLEE